jgi:hypothetical protein
MSPPADDRPLLRLERAVESLVESVFACLAREANLSTEAAGEFADQARHDAWTGALSDEAPPELPLRIRRAGLRAAARALRQEGVTRPPEAEPTPIPEGLTPEALRGALMEVVPGRRSVTGLHLRGYTVGELGALYDLDEPSMRDRLSESLENLRSALHRRAERMDQAGWSRALESRPIHEVFGMLREKDGVAGSRLHCIPARDLAEAVNGTHFRGGREGALDHAVVCEPCGRELRALWSLRGALARDHDPAVPETELEAVRREALSRPDLRPVLKGTPLPRRRWWPWILLVLAVAATAAALLLRT